MIKNLCISYKKGISFTLFQIILYRILETTDLLN